MRAHEFLTESRRWYRGISAREADAIRNGRLPFASSVPAPYDNMIVDYLDLSDDEAESLQQDLEGKQVINVTNDESTARGYGEQVLWFDDSLIDLDLAPYGVIDIESLQHDTHWGLM